MLAAFGNTRIYCFPYKKIQSRLSIGGKEVRFGISQELIIEILDKNHRNEFKTQERVCLEAFFFISAIILGDVDTDYLSKMMKYYYDYQTSRQHE